MPGFFDAPKIAAYVRVSTFDQNLFIQKNDISLRYPAHEITFFEEKCSAGKLRPELNRLLEALSRKEFNTLVIWRLDRLGRSAQELLNYAEVFRQSRINFISIRENIDLESPGGKLFYTLLAAFAEFERAAIRERVSAGVQAARKRNGGRWGRPRRGIDAELIRMWAEEGRTVTEIAKLAQCSRGTIMRRLEEAEIQVLGD